MLFSVRVPWGNLLLLSATFTPISVCGGRSLSRQLTFIFLTAARLPLWAAGPSLVCCVHVSAYCNGCVCPSLTETFFAMFRLTSHTHSAAPEQLFTSICKTDRSRKIRQKAAFGCCVLLLWRYLGSDYFFVICNIYGSTHSRWINGGNFPRSQNNVVAYLARKYKICIYCAESQSVTAPCKQECAHSLQARIINCRS